MRPSPALAFLLLAPGVLPSQDPAVAATLRRFEESRPGEKELAFYSLDWSPSLAAAKERAGKERRPILLIVNTNISAHCNLYSGHT